MGPAPELSRRRGRQLVCTHTAISNCSMYCIMYDEMAIKFTIIIIICIFHVKEIKCYLIKLAIYFNFCIISGLDGHFKVFDFNCFLT